VEVFLALKTAVLAGLVYGRALMTLRMKWLSYNQKKKKKKGGSGFFFFFFFRHINTDLALKTINNMH